MAREPGSVAGFFDFDLFSFLCFYDSLGVAFVSQSAILLGQFICLYGCFLSIIRFLT